MSDQPLHLVACVPVKEAAKLMPDYLERATAENGPYTVVRCPACEREMYLGTRSQKIIKAGIAVALCMVCVAQVHGNKPVVSLKGLVQP
jgi:hypothetical protein